MHLLKLVICESPDPDPNHQKLNIFTTAWQSGAKLSEVRDFRMVPSSHNGPEKYFLIHTFFRKIIRFVTI
jgi:hypothetical protein